MKMYIRMLYGIMGVFVLGIGMGFCADFSAVEAINNLSSAAHDKVEKYGDQKKIEKYFENEEMELIIQYKDNSDDLIKSSINTKAISKQVFEKNAQKLSGLLNTEGSEKAYYYFKKMLTSAISAERKKVKKQEYNRVKSLILANFPNDDITILEDYDLLSGTFIKTRNRKALTKLLNDENVKSVSENREYKLQTAESFPMIGRDTPQLESFNGANQTIVIFDSGCDYTRSPFNCSSTREEGDEDCPIVHMEDMTVTDDGMLDSEAGFHGTNVTAIAHGMAPEADIIVLDVIKNAYSASAMLAAIKKGIQWVVDHKEDYNIVAVNMGCNPI